METHPVQWAGRHHLARMTDNLERTPRLWHGVMGGTSRSHPRDGVVHCSARSEHRDDEALRATVCKELSRGEPYAGRD